MIPLALAVASYLLGAIPASYLAGRMCGVDLRRHGSGNLGATNTFRVLGAKVAAPVMLFDVFKGWLPAAVFPLALADRSEVWALGFGAAAILGHVFSVFLGFRGGKGVATASGVFLALAPAAVGVAFAVWLVVLRLGRMVSLASICAALVVIPLLFLTPVADGVRILGAGIALFVIVMHRANVGRILRGEEHRFGRPRETTAELSVEGAAHAADGETTA